MGASLREQKAIPRRLPLQSQLPRGRRASCSAAPAGGLLPSWLLPSAGPCPLFWVPSQSQRLSHNALVPVQPWISPPGALTGGALGLFPAIAPFSPTHPRRDSLRLLLGPAQLPLSPCEVLLERLAEIYCSPQNCHSQVTLNHTRLTSPEVTFLLCMGLSLCALDAIIRYSQLGGL